MDTLLSFAPVQSANDSAGLMMTETWYEDLQAGWATRSGPLRSVGATLHPFSGPGMTPAQLNCRY